MSLSMSVGMSSESLDLLMLDSLGEGQQQELSSNYHRQDIPHEGHHGNQRFVLDTTSNCSVVSETGNKSVSTGGGANNSNHHGSVTTLELHPNVILGIAEDEDSSNSSDRPHSCHVCNAAFKNKNHLSRHMRSHINLRPFPCQQCGKGFNRKEHLNKHIEAVHSPVKRRCPFCNREISRLDHLRRHIAKMHGVDCREKSKDKAAVLKVQLSGTNGSKQTAQLSFLTPNFNTGATGQTIITPIPIAHETNSQPKSDNAIDRLCKSKLTPVSEKGPSMTIIPSNVIGPGQGVATLAVQSTPTQKVLVHQRLPSGSNVNLSAISNGLAGLAHLSLSLGGQGQKKVEERRMGQQMFNCGVCGASFQSEKEMVAHTKNHKPQRYPCAECPRAYTRREKLTEHIRALHQGHKFSCQYCGRNLSRKDHVLRHIRSIHPEVYASTFAEIDEGNVTFDEKGRLVKTGDGDDKRRRSPASATLNIPSIGDVGVLLRSVCHICLKVFGTAYHLTRHVESCHNGDMRPFACAACNKMFKRKDHLTKHVKSHCPVIKEGSRATQTLSNASKEKSSPSSSSEGESQFRKQQHFEGNQCSSGMESSSQSHKPHDQDPPQTHHQNAHLQDGQVERNGGNSRMLTEESLSSSSDCTHMVLQNLRVELGTSGQHGDVHHDLHPHHGDTSGLSDHHHQDKSISQQSDETQQKLLPRQNNEFSVAVIDSFMEGSVNVVVVDEEIQSFLQQSSASHMTTTFPCGQCQKEFTARDLLIAHLQEHENDNAIHGVHDQRIADISFSDF